MSDQNCDCPECGGDIHDEPTDALRALPVSFWVEKDPSEFQHADDKANTVRRLLNMRALMLTLAEGLNGTPAYHAALRENSFALRDFGIPSDVSTIICDHMLGDCGVKPWER